MNELVGNSALGHFDGCHAVVPAVDGHTQHEGLPCFEDAHGGCGCAHACGLRL